MINIIRSGRSLLLFVSAARGGRIVQIEDSDDGDLVIRNERGVPIARIRLDPLVREAVPCGWMESRDRRSRR